MLNYSRGPVNYPSNQKLFNNFTSNKNFISNNMLSYQAAPISTGSVQDTNTIKGIPGKYVNDFAVYQKSC